MKNELDIFGKRNHLGVRKKLRTLRTAAKKNKPIN